MNKDSPKSKSESRKALKMKIETRVSKESGLPPTLGQAGSSRIAKIRARKRSSEEGRRADALALRADERRDKLR